MPWSEQCPPPPRACCSHATASQGRRGFGGGGVGGPSAQRRPLRSSTSASLSLSPRPWSWLGPNLYARPPGGPERPWSPPAPPSRFFSGFPPLIPLDSRKTGRKLQLLAVECRPSVGTEVAATFGAPGGIPARRLRHRAARAAPPPPAAGISSRFRALPPPPFASRPPLALPSGSCDPLPNSTLHLVPWEHVQMQKGREGGIRAPQKVGRGGGMY